MATPPDLTLDRPDAALIGTEAGAGPAVLLLHAGGERRTVWTPVSDVLVAHGFRTVAYDLRGHGESGATRAQELLPFGEDVAAMIRAIDGQVLVVGSSLGGQSALLALEDADVQARATGLVLVDVVPDPNPESTYTYLSAHSGALAENPLVADVLAHADELRAAARALALPTLLVRGGQASPLTDADVTRFLDLVPHARVRGIPAAGHLIAREAPTELAQVLLDELADPAVSARRNGSGVGGPSL